MFYKSITGEQSGMLSGGRASRPSSLGKLCPGLVWRVASAAESAGRCAGLRVLARKRQELSSHPFLRGMAVWKKKILLGSQQEPGQSSSKPSKVDAQERETALRLRGGKKSKASQRKTSYCFIKSVWCLPEMYR